jgi:transcriptional regulator with XRE-family HTH domain
MANSVGPLIKEARTRAKLSQEALAGKIEGLSASDLGKAERGEKELSQATLKQIAKLTGVTQSSLINAAKESTYGPAKKTAASTTKKPAEKTASAAKKTSASTKKPAASAKKDAFELTAAEKKLVELYREADSETKKKAVAVLKGEGGDASGILAGLLGDQVGNGDLLGNIIGTAMDMLGKK